MILNQTYPAHPMRFLEAADPIALAALEHVLERDAQDVRKLLEWLPAAQTRRDRRAIIARARDLLAEIEFAIKHSKNNTDLIMPRLNNLFDKFVDNEFYTITEKFDRMREFQIIDTKEFVRKILESTKLFRYECSDKNNDPSKKSREVLEILDNEALLLNEAPNLWIGYNAFNQMLHNTLKKSFSQQERLDKKLFDAVYEMA